jgi:NADPH:quinone reductase
MRKSLSQNESEHNDGTAGMHSCLAALRADAVPSRAGARAGPQSPRSFMKAFVLTGFGRPPEFADVAKPEPGPGEILVRVHATSVNPVDHMIRSGFFRATQEYRFPAVFGRNVAGVVEVVGDGVTRVGEGDEVYGFVKRDYIGDGTFAEYIVVPGDFFVAAKPSRLSLQQAGTLAQAGITALECVEAVPSGPGHVVLVNGATGGLGTFAVQIAKARGADVVATTRSADRAELLRSLGADHVVDPTRDDLVKLVREVAPEGVDGLVDFVKHVDSAVMGQDEGDARREFARLCHGVLREGGRAASVTNGGAPELLAPFGFTNVHSTPSPANLERLAAHVDDRGVTPVVMRTFSFDDIEAAFDRLLAGGMAGKIAVSLEG